MIISACYFEDWGDVRWSWEPDGGYSAALLVSKHIKYTTQQHHNALEERLCAQGLHHTVKQDIMTHEQWKVVAQQSDGATSNSAVASWLQSYLDFEFSR